MNEEMKNNLARNFISLFPLFHRKIFRRNHGITGMQLAGFHVMGTLAKMGPLPISEVARRLYISKPYMTRLVDSLIADDLVERLPDPNDRRVVRIMVTEKGKGRLNEAGTYFRDDVMEFLTTLDEGDLQTLNECLEQLNRILEKEKAP